MGDEQYRNRYIRRSLVCAGPVDRRVAGEFADRGSVVAGAGAGVGQISGSEHFSVVGGHIADAEMWPGLGLDVIADVAVVKCALTGHRPEASRIGRRACRTGLGGVIASTIGCVGVCWRTTSHDSTANTSGDD